MRAEKEHAKISWARKDVYRLFGVFAAVFLIWGSWVYVALENLDHSETTGQIGDTFGLLNTLFSGLAFAGLIFTIILQQRELGYQRDELRTTNEQLKSQADSLNKQNFESTFFNLLRLYTEIIDGMHVTLETHKPLAKRQVFEGLCGLLKKNVKSAQEAEERKNPEGDEDGIALNSINAGFNTHINAYHYLISHYIRTVRQILVFVDGSDRLKQDKELYADVLRDQLSTHELLILFYCSLTTNGIQDYRPIFDKYRLFVYLEKRYLFDPRLHERFLWEHNPS